VGTLFLVATPIGNLEDISFRALRILRDVHLIAAEDTRRTAKLLQHYDIHTALISYYEHNKIQRLDKILSVLRTHDIALVSDAGTPLINDPGYELVAAVLESGFNVCPIPGPSAPIAAITASGLPSDSFLYLGYLPRTQNSRKRLLLELRQVPYTLVFLETPYRIIPSLEDIRDVLGDRKIAIARELTKMHESILRCSVTAAIDYFAEHKPVGEFTIVIQGQSTSPEYWEESTMREEISAFLESGESPTRIASILANISGWSRRDIYKLVVEMNPKKESMNKEEI